MTLFGLLTPPLESLTDLTMLLPIMQVYLLIVTSSVFCFRYLGSGYGGYSWEVRAEYTFQIFGVYSRPPVAATILEALGLG